MHNITQNITQYLSILGSTLLRSTPEWTTTKYDGYDKIRQNTTVVLGHMWFYVVVYGRMWSKTTMTTTTTTTTTLNATTTVVTVTIAATTTMSTTTTTAVRLWWRHPSPMYTAGREKDAKL